MQAMNIKGQANYFGLKTHSSVLIIHLKMVRNYAINILVYLQTRPLIGMVNVEEELRILEEAATSAYGAYKEQLDTKAKLEAENTDLEAELAAVRAKISSEQGDLGSFQEKMAKVSAQKADLEVQLAEFTERLAAEERMKANAGEEKRNMDREMGNIKQDLGDVQSKVNKENVSTKNKCSYWLEYYNTRSKKHQKEIQNQFQILLKSVSN